MSAVLEMYDERLPGTKPELRGRLELPVDRISARDMIRCRIEMDIALHNASEKLRVAGDAETYEAKRNAANPWLVTPGSVEEALNGRRPAYGPRPGLSPPQEAAFLEAEPLIAAAVEAFKRNGFFMIFDERQITDLDEVVTVRDDSVLTFLRLTPLVGG